MIQIVNEATSTLLMAAVSVISLASVGVSIWNAFIIKATTVIVMELQLNMKREFNGRYVTLTSFADAKERIQRLEEHEDVIHQK